MQQTPPERMKASARPFVSIFDYPLVEDFTRDATRAETVQLNSAEVVRRSTPVAFTVDRSVRDPDHEWGVRFSRREYKAGPVGIARLPSGSVDPRVFVAFDAAGNLVTESLRTSRALEVKGYKLDQNAALPPSTAIREEAGTGVLIGAQSDQNYFHWLVGGISRIPLFRRLGFERPVRFVVPPLNGFRRETLRLAGVRDEDVIELDPSDGSFVRFDELFVGTRGFAKSPLFAPTAVQAVAAIGPPAASSGNRLWVSRARAARRKIQPEAEVEAVVASHGFDVIVPDDMSVAEQIETFRSASVVLSVHGAGLANSIFAPRDALLLELQPEQFDYAHAVVYWSLSSAVGQRYGTYICQKHGPEGVIPREADIAADPDHLDAFLGEALKQEGDRS